jgi:hypothetical protein
MVGVPDVGAARLRRIYLSALDQAHEVPPADLFPDRSHRAIPYIYKDEEIVALMAATGSLRFALRQATYRTLIGLLSVTGMPCPPTCACAIASARRRRATRC